MSQWIDTSHSRHAGLIRSLVVGTLLLFTGIALGLKLRAPDAGSDIKKPAQNVQPAALKDSAARIAATETLFDQLALAQQAEQVNHHVSEAESMPFASAPAPVDMTQPDPAIAARREELQYLQEVLPDNQMIPHDKTPQQLDAMWDEFQHYHALGQRIEAGNATDAEREQFYAIRREKFEEEKALITLCRDVAANSLASADEQQVLMCQHMAEHSDERLQVIEESIVALEQELLLPAQER